MRNKVYFLSDIHLGSAFHAKNLNDKEFINQPASVRKEMILRAQHEVERKLCRWFDMAKQDAQSVFLLGDIFDYWFEYKNVVPRGFTRVFGKIAELTDSGIEVHFFIGNHDIWVTDYLQSECGMIVHTQPLVKEIFGKKFFMAHGDGLGHDALAFKILRRIFHSKTARVPYAAIHPRWTVGFAQRWSTHNRKIHVTPQYFGEDKEHAVLFAKEQLKETPAINFFVFGHRHIMLDLMLSQTSRVIILGDWIDYFSYGVFDGENFTLEMFENEE